MVVVVLSDAANGENTFLVYLPLDEPFGPMLLLEQLPLQLLPLLLLDGDKVAGMSATKAVASFTRTTSRAPNSRVSPT